MSNEQPTPPAPTTPDSESTAAPTVPAAPPAPAYAYPAPAPSTTGAGGLAIAALIVAIAAFLSGWIPFFGIPLGITGLILAIITLRKGRGRGLGLTALVLSALAVVASIIVIVIAVVFNDQIQKIFDESTGANSPERTTILVPVETPCYTFSGPSTYINNINEADIADCFTQLELWGEVDKDGTFSNTGVGAVHGNIFAEVVPESTVTDWGTTDDLAATDDYLAESYYPDFGTVKGKAEKITLDGQPALITRFTSDAAATKSTAVITSFAPSTFETTDGESKLLVISFATIEENGEELIDAAIKSWKWR